jgi:hypothetical protein
MRRAIALLEALGIMLLATLGVSLSAVRALAKPGEGEHLGARALVAISGPGLEVPMILGDDGAWRTLYLTTFHAYGAAAVEPPGELGPRYLASYSFVDDEGRVSGFEQSIYPCAERGAVWAFTPSQTNDARQRSGQPVTPGWLRSAALSQILTDNGLPGCGGRTPAAAVVTSGGAGSSSTGVWFGLVLVAALALVGAFGSRSARAPVAGR